MTLSNISTESHSKTLFRFLLLLHSTSGLGGHRDLILLSLFNHHRNFSFLMPRHDIGVEDTLT
jgi:hypothetical protein